MTKEDLIRKVMSRKFITAVALFVSMLLIFFGVAESTATQVASLIIAGGSIMTYIYSEGKIDAARQDNEEVLEYLISLLQDFARKEGPEA